MQNTFVMVFLLTATVILFAKKVLIENMETNFMLGDHVKESLLIYKRGFKYLVYKIKTKEKITFAEWSKSQS